MKTIQIVATKRTGKKYAEDKYDISIANISNKADRVDYNKNYLKIITQPYGNNEEIIIECHTQGYGYSIISTKEQYYKKELEDRVAQFKKLISIESLFDENPWAESKTRKVDLSKQITIKVFQPTMPNFMESFVVKGRVFTTIKNTPPDYPVDYGYVEYPKGKICKSVAQLVQTLFRELDILGAEVKINGKEISYNEANQTRPRNIKLIEIFL